jgi:hypothetical protein
VVQALEYFSKGHEGLINLVLIDSGSGTIKIGLAHLDNDYNICDFFQDQLGLKFAEDLNKKTLVSEILQSGHIQNIHDNNNNPLNLCSLFNQDISNNAFMSILKPQCSEEAYQFLIKNYGNKFSEAIKQNYIKSISEIVKNVHKNGGKDTEVWLVGTAALRKADDGQILLNELEESIKPYASNINFKIISQQAEGEYAFEGASIVTKINPKDAIVWDIGGGSMQITFNDDSSIQVLGNEIASTHMFELAKQLFQKQPDDSLYPMSCDQIEKVIEIAKKEVAFPKEAHIEQNFIQKKTNENTRIIGVGNIHNGILEAMIYQNIIQKDQTTFDKLELKILINNFIEKSPSEVTEILPEKANLFAFEFFLTNAILVYGAMHKYFIDEVEVVEANNLNALLYKAQQAAKRQNI